MAHFAKLDANNVVLEIIVVSNDAVQNLSFPESEPIGIAFCQSLFGADTDWKQTSYNGNIRKNYAGIGYTYRADIDAFVPPQPYPSWTLDDDARWQPPVPYPNDGKVYRWDESTLSWVEIVV
jgi:hypothetical protein